ncbi:MAG TPA: FG-GAP-like repeat-containing protein, partial [Polyangiaceae bacterium]
DPAFSRWTQGYQAAGVALGDYDRDGDLDVFLACLGRDLLLENQGDGTFVDVTDSAGVAGPDDISPGALWVDVNNDGLLDLVVYDFVDLTYEATNSGPLSPLASNRLYLNRGDGTFSDETNAANLVTPGATHTVAAADADGDGKLELYVAHDTMSVDGEVRNPKLPRDELWTYQDTNAGVPSYQNVADSVGIEANRSSMGIEFLDVDRDGRLDIYFSDFGGNDLYIWDQAAQAYVNRAVDYDIDAAHAPSGRSAVSWGVLGLDVDRDGKLEMLIVNGSVAGSGAQQISYYEQAEPAGRFGRKADAAGLNDVPDPTDIAAARGAYRGDLDGDSDEDIVLGIQSGRFRLFENRSDRQGQCLRLRLTGTVSAPDPVGSKVTLTLTDGSKITTQRTAGGQPYGQSDSVMELVIGDRKPSELTVEWPSGFVQRLEAPALAAKELWVREPSWLTVTPRSFGPGSAARLTYVAVDASGQELGVQGSGRLVTVERSDGVPAPVTDLGDGSYTASFPHPGAPGTVTLKLSVDGTPMAIRPLLFFR